MGRHDCCPNSRRGGGLRHSTIGIELRMSACHVRLWRVTGVTCPGKPKREIRQEGQVAVVTRMKKNRRMVEPFDDWDQARCEQGQSLPWLGCGDELLWFGVRTADSLCHRRREASHGPKGFGHRPDQHETLPGLLPLNTLAAKRLLQPARAWIEPAQAYEKNVRGRGDLFLNSLRLTWTMCLLADAVGLLRAWALLDLPPKRSPPACVAAATNERGAEKPRFAQKIANPHFTQ